MNILLVVVPIALAGLLHLGAGLYAGTRLTKAFTSIPDWRQVLRLGAFSALLFSLAMAGWVALVFLIPRNFAPAPVLNVPAWVLLGAYAMVEANLRPSTKSVMARAWGGVGLAVPGCSVFAYVYHQPLAQIFGPIRLT